ncbi:MAG: hypothetical protein EA401_03625 [Planctomycetota bacterium]|nr:MAG: hypothetical protein EA401_03625 [Planctomycetota bacterium]
MSTPEVHPQDGDPFSQGAAEANPTATPGQQPTPPPASKSMVPLVVGAMSIVVAVGVALIPTLNIHPGWWWRVLAGATALGGCWLWGRSWGDMGRLTAVGVAFVVAAVAAGNAWWWLAWSAGGIAAGFLCAWGYAHGHRGRWLSIAVLVLSYLGLAAAGLIRIAGGDSIWWSLSQGLITLAIACALLFTGASFAGQHRAGRIALALALALPYIALIMVALRNP